MLSKPEHGWTEFSLGKTIYSLSYLTDIPTNWLDEAIHGLQNLTPFSVHGCCEPGRMICTVSYWNCHILFEDNGRDVLSKEDTRWEIAHISMLQFCRALHKDISENIEQWCVWLPGSADSTRNRKTSDAAKCNLQTKLAQLRKLIEVRESRFGEDRCFL
jgi:hypothetical protein